MGQVRLKVEVVREEMTRRGMSQNWLAQRIGISKGYLSLLMRDLRSPGAEVQERLLDVLRFRNFDDLFIYVRDDTRGAAA